MKSYGAQIEEYTLVNYENLRTDKELKETYLVLLVSHI